MDENIVRIGIKTPATYVATILNLFKQHNKVKAVFLESRRYNAEAIFELMEGGGFTISQEYSEPEEYEKIIWFFKADKSSDGKEGRVEYFPKDNSIRITKGNLAEQYKKNIKQLVEAEGIRRMMKATFFSRDIYRK